MNIFEIEFLFDAMQKLVTLTFLKISGNNGAYIFKVGRPRLQVTCVGCNKGDYTQPNDLDE